MGGDPIWVFLFPRQWVSIHAPAWGATFEIYFGRYLWDVSIHAPAWGATSILRLFPLHLNVSIHAPAWGATTLIASSKLYTLFQSTPPHGGRQASKTPCYSIVRFNPRPRMGGDPPRLLWQSISRVSIHAPAWGATYLRRLLLRLKVFQSTPPHGGRPYDVQSESPFTSFNPRPRMGGDIVKPLFMHEGIPVSIHAPAWGATYSEDTAWYDWSFQSTPPHGGRPGSFDAPINYNLFQSTPPHGGRLNPCMIILSAIRFNPRPRMGGDIHPQHAREPTVCFNPRPRMGGDIHPQHAREPTVCFNPRPRMGGDFKPLTLEELQQRFNPRPRMGGDPDRLSRLDASSRFNPRPRMGGDSVTSMPARLACVSIHAPAWGATASAGWRTISGAFQSTPPHGGRLTN